MALALYRKYRPRTFAEVIGQEHVTEPLSQALRSGRLHHAYLFSGPRGCGKTSSARILARSLNCEQGPTPEPCGVCASCKSLANDGAGSIDVIEIDAASHGGVDDARDLREKAFFAPASSRYKIYVIDEAHMVSSAGFNALLKLVEEPPDYVKFIFATTEPEKVLGTIRSRTHHYPFRLIPPAVLRPYLQQLTEAEGVHVDPAVLPLVVRAGGGSARDSLSVLDQLISGAGPEGVSYPRAVSLLGVTDAALIDEMCDAVAAGDGAAAYQTIDRVAEAGHDPRRFASDLLERFRDLIVLQQVPDAVAKGLIDGPADQLEQMGAQATRLGPGTLSRCADIVHNGLVEMRGTTAPRLLLELITARMLLPAADDATNSLLQRLERMERRLTLSADEVRPQPEAAGQAAPGGGGISAARAAAAAAGRRAPAVASPVSGAGSVSADGASGAAAPVSAMPGSASPVSAAPGSPAAGDEGPPWDTSPVPAAASSAPHAGGPVPVSGGPVSAAPASRVPVSAAPGSPSPVSGVPDSPSPGAAGPGAAGPGSAAPRPDGPTSAAPGSAGAGSAAPRPGGPASAGPGSVAPGPVAASSVAPVSAVGRSEPAGLMPDAPEEPGFAAAAEAPGQLSAAAIREVWPEIMTAVSRKSKKIAALAQGATVRDLEGQTVVLTFRFPAHAKMVAAEPALISDALYEALGGRWQIRCDVAGESGPSPGSGGSAPRSPRGGPSGPAQRSPQAQDVPQGGSPQRPQEGPPRQDASRTAPSSSGAPARQREAAPRSSAVVESDAGDEWPEPARPGGLATAVATQVVEAPPEDDEGWPEPALPGGAMSAGRGFTDPSVGQSSPAVDDLDGPGGGRGFGGSAGLAGGTATTTSEIGGAGAAAGTDGSGGITGQHVGLGGAGGGLGSDSGTTVANGGPGGTSGANGANHGQGSMPGAGGGQGGAGGGQGGAGIAGGQGSAGIAGGQGSAGSGHGGAGGAGGGQGSAGGGQGSAGGGPASQGSATGAGTGPASQGSAPATSNAANPTSSHPGPATDPGTTADRNASRNSAPAAAAAPPTGGRASAPGGRAPSSGLAAARAAAAGAGRGTNAAKTSAWADGSPTEEAPYDPEYDGPPRAAAAGRANGAPANGAPANGGPAFEGFDPGDEPLDDVIDEKTARQSSEQQAVQLLRDALGAEKISES
ncbi:DNA polymerase III subunit gamma and tau [Actinoplanes sp. NPDC049599]|uniref:DNA polymerase III subunit gamma and tau n=1 Tax=Actinoplanes sp. NPDC049599 TaxID=3363903 RepID=UPI0037B24B35